MDLAGDLISIIVGIYLIIFHRSFGKWTVREQNRFWKCSLGELTAEGIAVFALICGAAFAFFGVIGMVGHLHFG
jgi:hypothetical protein